MDSSDDSDEVGYRKPPKRTRFKKGQSGNPRGRPKGSGMRSAAEKVLEQTVPITLDGVRRRVPITEALLMQLAQKALVGDSVARRDFLKIAKQVSQAYRDDEAAADNGLRITIVDVLEEFACGTSLEALGMIEKGRGVVEYQYQIAPWVVEAALTRGVVLSEEQRARVEEFIVKA